MLEFTKISNLISLYRALNTLEQTLKRLPPEEGDLRDEDEPSADDLLAILVELVRRLMAAGAELGIPWLEKRVRRLEMKLEKQDLSPEIVRHEAEEIAAMLKDELASKTFFVLEGQDGRYYAEALLTREAASKFPASDEELSEAGKCFALGRYTASVFHAMRALEPALEALRRNVRAPKRNSWGPIIVQIETKIRCERRPGTAGLWRWNA